MSVAVLYRVLALDGNRVLDSWCWESDGRVGVLIKPPRDTAAVSVCGSARVRVHDRAVRAKTWHQPTFVNGQRRITKTFEASIEQWLSRLTIQDIVESFIISWNTVCEIDLARLKKLTRPKLSSLKRLSIDDDYLGARHGFVTVAGPARTLGDRGSLGWLAPGFEI